MRDRVSLAEALGIIKTSPSIQMMRPSNAPRSRRLLAGRRAGDEPDKLRVSAVPGSEVRPVLDARARVSTTERCRRPISEVQGTARCRAAAFTRPVEDQAAPPADPGKLKGLPVKRSRSSSAKGNYYKLRTKRWLEAQGYAVGFMERVMWVRPKVVGERPIPIKVDQFGADLLAMNVSELIFVQAKLAGRRDPQAGGTARMSALREFAKYPFPPFVERWVVQWRPRAREPEITCVKRSAR